jgi:hypothetical protein
MNSTTEFYSYEPTKNQLNISFNKDDLHKYYVDKLIKWYLNPDRDVPRIYSLIIDIFKSFSKEIGAFKFKYDPKFNYTWLIDDDLKGPGWRMGITWLLESPIYPYRSFGFKLSTKDKDKIAIEVDGDFFKELYDYWNEPVLQYFFKKLKTQQNHEFYFSNFYLGKPNKKIIKQLKELRDSCTCPVYVLFPRSFSYTAFLQYICLMCGKAYICDCFKDTREFWQQYLYSLYSNDGTIEGGDAVSKIVTEKWNFREKICHVCRGIKPDQEFTSSNYCSTFAAHYSPWIYNNIHLETGNDNIKVNDEIFRIHENKLRKKLEIPLNGEKWINETQLFKSLKSYFGKDMQVIHHARPKHLSGQEYDIFFSQYNLAIEYDGPQHEIPIDYFGGEKGLKETRRRDLNKEKKAKAYGIRIIHVKEDYLFDKLASKIENLIESK